MGDHFLAWAGTALLGITGLGVLLKKHFVAFYKYLKVARAALDLLDDVLIATKDGKLSADEVKVLEIRIQSLKDTLGPAKA